MCESRIKWQLSKKAQVRFDAAQAALCALARSLAPLPIGVLLDVAGIDPVVWKQRQMLARLGIDPLSKCTSGAHGRVGGTTSRHDRQLAVWGGQAIARGVTLVLKRSGKAASARSLQRSVPLIGAAISFVVVYRQTAASGLAILDEGPNLKPAYPKSRNRGDR